VEHKPFAPSAILVHAPNWVGDAVMSLPALRAIRARFPGIPLSVLARPWVADLYVRERAVDRVVPHTAARRLSDWSGRRRLAGELSGFDCAILLPNSFDSALLVWLAGIRVRIGYRRDGRGWLLTDPVTPPAAGEIPRHQRFYYLELLRRAGLIGEYPAAAEIRLDGIEAARERGTERMRDAGLEGPVIGISPGAAYGGAKRWPGERFAEAAARLAGERGGAVALFGSAGERDLCEAVVRAAGTPAHNFAGETTLAEFIELASACSVFLTNDSGSMHIASAAGVPTVAVFGATDDTATGPTGARARVVREQVECSPCLRRECPIDHRCMQRVTVERVARAALEVW
jgi:heptosyltransferase-2